MLTGYASGGRMGRPRVAVVNGGGGGGGATPFGSDNLDTGNRSGATGMQWTTFGNTVTVSNEQARSGSYSMKFLYSTTGEHAEQRFTFAGASKPEVWVEFWVYVPADWDNTPIQAGNVNNKLFALWGGVGLDQDGYQSAENAKIVMEYMPDSAFGFNSADTSLRLMYDNNGNPITIQVDTVRRPLITASGPWLRGQWNRMRIHLNVGTGPGTGTYRVWLNDTLTFDRTDMNLYPDPVATDPWFEVGYFVGSAATGTDFNNVALYVDDVAFYDTDPGWT